MADPLLTTLCSICHVSPPVYKCPRCAIRTCSLPCVTKHKAWSECTGERDATAYLKPSKLRTPAGVDHDYNFLHGIERSMERAERLIVGEKALVEENDLRPLTVQEVKWKMGRDGKKRKVVVTRLLRESKGRVFERFLSQRLKKLNITVVCAPMGMTRQRENNTTLNRKSGRINWQVEWFVFQDAPTADPQSQDDASRTTRILSKLMDDVPLYEAYPALLQSQQTQGQDAAEQPKRPKVTPRVGQFQSVNIRTWHSNGECLQDPFSGVWITEHPANLDQWPSEVDAVKRQRFQFFLAPLQMRSDMPTELRILDPAVRLRDVLSNSKVLEFPTIYVLEGDRNLPPGFTVEPKHQSASTSTQQKKRKGESGKPSRPAKRMRPHQEPGKTLEEGEVDGRDDGMNSDDNDGNPAEHGEAMGLEAGEVIAEQSFDEDDDSTSSSGSDSE